MARHRSKRPPPEIGLHMECVEEDLEPCQVSYYTKADREFKEIQNRLDNYVKKLKAEVIEKTDNCCVLQLNSVSHGSIISPSSSGKSARPSIQCTQQNYPQIVDQGLMTRGSGNSPRNTYVVVDPGLNIVIGQVSPSIAPQEQSQCGGRNTSTRGKGNVRRTAVNLNETDCSTISATKAREKNKSSIPQTGDVQEIQAYAAGTNLCGGYRLKLNAKQIPPPSKPNESNSIGGLTIGGKASWKSTSDEASSKSNADSSEVNISKATGKTFPSLVVVARPYLKTKFFHQSKVTQERTALDAKVKGVLMYTSTKFTEWLIQQGLIRSEQTCQMHLNNDMTPVKLKLGMYSDISKFPYSGGYVWISDCCPSQFVSVYFGSIFEGAPHPPTTLLKLIYHWACQTNVQNIVQWVKVDNLYVKNFFTHMRAVCTQAVHEKYKKMGGARKKIEVGVISLGTTSQDGNKRQVKVEVLGVMDYENKLIRLRAVEPYSDEKSLKRRFIRILQPLEEWVNKDSTIVTDFTVNKAALNAMGFHTVLQATSDVRYSNHNIMEYLRRIVPRMFQNTLSLLSRQIIQQFLDELVWREVWGPLPSQAFTSIIAHMAEQTKINVDEGFITRLVKVASNPFDEWTYSVWNSQNDSENNSSPKASPTQDFVQIVPFEASQGTEKGSRTRKRKGEQILSEIGVSSKKPTKPSSKEKVKKEEKGRGSEAAVKRDIIELPEEIVKFLEGEQVPVEPYYYGCRKGDRLEGDKGCRTLKPFNVKCCVCNKPFTDNIVLMKHMTLHCQTVPELKINLKDVYQCNNCFLGFNTNLELISHLEDVHFIVNNKVDCDYMCHICEIKFSCRNLLVYHLQKTHLEKEMPYECGVCFFRTSVYRFFVEHFVQAHQDEGHVFCPYCLKVVTLCHNGTQINLNVHFYMSHLEKHQNLAVVKDCDRCQLSFIHRGIWEQHLKADHTRWEDLTDVEPLEELHTGLLMPEPEGMLKPSSPLKTFKSPKLKNQFSVNKFKALEVRSLQEDETCMECEEFLLPTSHFMGNYTCQKCRYSTCCERAMTEHVTIFHESPVQRFTIGVSTILPEEMFCSCGFSSVSGNRIAKHLALCDKKTAYKNLDSAMAVVEAASPEMSTKGEGQNMLNMLGLVRKSPEICSTLGEVVDVEMRSPPPSIEKKTENFPPEREVVDVEMRSPPDIQIEPEKCSQEESKNQSESNKELEELPVTVKEDAATVEIKDVGTPEGTESEQENSTKESPNVSETKEELVSCDVSAVGPAQQTEEEVDSQINADTSDTQKEEIPSFEQTQKVEVTTPTTEALEVEEEVRTSAVTKPEDPEPATKVESVTQEEKVNKVDPESKTEDVPDGCETSKESDSDKVKTVESTTEMTPTQECQLVESSDLSQLHEVKDGKNSEEVLDVKEDAT